MKKKKLFLGLAIASAALFSLAACNAPSQSGTSTSVPAASTSTPTSTTTQAAQDYTATFVAIVDEERDNDLLSKTATSVNGKFARPSDADMAVAGHVFEGFYTSATLTTEFNFDTAVTGNTTIYCKYHKMSKYDELKADTTHNLAAFDFDGTFTPESGSSFGGDKVAVKADATKVTFNGTGAVLKTGNVIVDLGAANATKTGLYKIYFEVNFAALQGEAFFQVDGTSAGKSDTEVFALRTSSSKFHYRFDGGSDIALGSDNAVSVSTNYKFYVELNTAEGKVSIYKNGTKIIDEVSTTINKVNGIKFTCKSGGTSEKTIDNVAINLEETAVDPVVAAKATALSAITTYQAGTEYTGYSADTATAADKAKKKLADAQIATSTKAINDATTEAEVATAKTAWDTFAAAEKVVVTVTPYTAASTAAPSTLGTYNVATVKNGTVSLALMSFKAYKVTKVYTDEALTNEFAETTAIAADTQLYAKVEEATLQTVTYTPAETAPANWETDGSYKAEQKDGKDGDSSTPTTGTYECLNLSLGEAADAVSKYLKTPTISANVNSVIINIDGFTAGSADAKNYVTVTAYDSNDNAIGTMKIYTTTKKAKGHFTSDAAGTVTDIELVAEGNISYLKFTCNAAGKSYFITSLSVSYYA